MHIDEYEANAEDLHQKFEATLAHLEREAEEKRRDTELAAEIAQRKKNTNERGIKLTAVLMASRKMLGVCARLGTMQMEGVLIPS